MIGGRARAASLVIAFIVAVIPSALVAAAEPHDIAPDQDLADLLLVRSAAGRAVIRFARGALETVRVGDRLGRDRATIVEIEAKRMVLDAQLAGRDGQSDRVRIIVRDGERGGSWYHETAGEAPPPVKRPVPAAARTAPAQPSEPPRR